MEGVGDKILHTKYLPTTYMLYIEYVAIMLSRDVFFLPKA